MDGRKARAHEQAGLLRAAVGVSNRVVEIIWFALSQPESLTATEGARKLELTRERSRRVLELIVHVARWLVEDLERGHSSVVLRVAELLGEVEEDGLGAGKVGLLRRPQGASPST